MNIMREAADIVRYREFLKNLVIRDIKVRYKRSTIGFLWVMLNPLFMMFILYMVFSELFKVSTVNYTAYIISGLIIWNFFSQSTATAVASLTGNSNLIKKIYIPKTIFPLSVVLSAMINFVFSLVPLVIIFYLTGTPLGPRIYLVPIIIILVAVFSFGITLFLSTLTVFFHDTVYIYEVILMAWMWMTPLFYPESIVPAKFRMVLDLNPFYYFINVFRGALYMENPFLAQQLLYCFLFSLAMFAGGWLFFNRLREKVIFYL